MIKKVLMGLAFCLMVGSASAVEITMKTVSAENPCSLEKTLYFSNCKLPSLQYLEANCFQKFGGITDNRLYRTGDAPLSNAGYFSNSGLLGRRTVRFGQDAAALSESQLSRIKYKAEDGSLVALKLTSDGYLSRASSGLYMFVR